MSDKSPGTSSSAASTGSSADESGPGIDTANLPASAAVKGAIERGAQHKDGLTAIELAIETLRYRPVYGNQQGTAKRHELERYLTGQDTSKFTRMTSIEWFNEVCKLVDLTKIKSIRGKQLLIGLCMLDAPLKEQLTAGGFLAAIINEVVEKPEKYFTPEGLVGYEGLGAAAGDEIDDYLDSSEDNPLESREEDLLDRAEFADFLVRLLNKTSLEKGAFAMHLYAPWGAGKTSFMNIMKHGFEKGTPDDLLTYLERPQWHAINFNAWQNQNLTYPWWNFMNNLYSQLKPNLSYKYRFREWFWRFKAQRMHQTFALVVICMLLFMVNKQTGPAGLLDSIEKVLGALAGIWAIAISVSQNFVGGSQKAAQNYLDNKDNPMADYKEKFKQLVNSIAPARIVIFIDDLDRCKSNYVVELLENIQTIFKDSNVLFVIAADIKWLHASYEVEYNMIKPYVSAEGKSLGPLFIEKMFQLSVTLPGVPQKIKEQCWTTMLGIEREAEAGEGQTAERQKPDDGKRSATRIEPTAAEFKADHDVRIGTLRTLTDERTIKSTQHFLKQYYMLIDLNPRNMKRLLNTFLVNKATSLISDINIPKEQMALYSIIYIQWPVLAVYLMKNPQTLQLTDYSKMGEIGELLSRPEVRAVIEGKGFGGPLTVETLVQCGVLFNE